MTSLITLPVEAIRHRSDARHRSDDALAALADSIAKIGLINPIRVRQVGEGFEVVAGSHRLQACELVGLHQIDCIVVDDDDLRAELAMIDENLVRAELSPSDRATQTARRKAIYLEIHPETAHGGDRKSDRVDNLPTRSFAEETAAITGADARTVRRDAERGEKVIPEAFAIIRGTRLDTGVYLDKLKRLPPSEQVHTANRDLAWEKKRAEEPRSQGGIDARYQSANAAKAEPRTKMFEGFTAMVDAIEAVPIDDLIASAGRQRAVLGQRASGLADHMGEIMERLDR